MTFTEWAIADMTKTPTEFWINFILLIVTGIIIGIMIMFIIQTTSKNTYREGQIDAINGEIKYELKKQSDGEIRWIKKEKKPI